MITECISLCIVVSRPCVAAVVHERITAFIAAHRGYRNLTGVREIRLERTLNLEHIAVHKVGEV